MINRNRRAWWMVGMSLAVGIAGTTLAAQRTRTSPSATAEARVRQVAALRESLTAGQRTALIDAAGGWLTVAGAPEDVLTRRVTRDLEAILTPAQMRQFQSAIETSEVPEVPETPEVPEVPDVPGEQTVSSCFASSKAGLIFSVTASMGCEAETAATATQNAYLASANSTMCQVQGSETCAEASRYAALSTTQWYGQLEVCDLAGIAALLEGITYYSCGGQAP